MIINFKSYMPDELWPAFSNPAGSQMLALLFQLEKSQYLSPEEIQVNQFLQINRLFRHAIKTVPFYKNSFKAAGFMRSKEITPEQWLQVPILSRSMVQENRQDLLSRRIPEMHGDINELTTSGSTGVPIHVTGTDITQFFWRACALRDHFWHQRDFSCKIAAIRRVAAGQSEYPGDLFPDWGIVTEGIIKTGHSVILNSSTALSLQAEFLLREQPDYFITYPSNLEALAKYFMQENLQLNKLKGVRAFGEALGSEVRSTCREAWGVPLVDVYTAQEVGYIALQCPENENIYHVQAENIYVEVVDDEGKPCKPGEVGRVLLTALHNFAMPFIRYEIGDYAEVGKLCSCGRTLPVLSQILGRKRNMLVFPDGTKGWPSLGRIYQKRITKERDLQIKQFQFVQKSPERIEVRLVTRRTLNDDDKSYIIKVIQEELQHPFNIDIVCVEEIPRSKGGKFEDFICEVS